MTANGDGGIFTAGEALREALREAVTANGNGGTFIVADMLRVAHR